jgi:Mg2+ and Co2+ transporter CorA
MVADGHLLLVLHVPPKPDVTERVGRFFWRTPEGTWTSNELGTGLNGLNKHMDEYEVVIAELDRREEAAATADAYFDVLQSLAPLCRATRNLHQALQEARKLCPQYRELIDLRDRAYHIERTADLLYGETKNSLDYLVAERAERQAQASHRMASAAHRLNILAAFFFPIVAITAIFGVDLSTVASLFGMDPNSSPAALALLLACAVMGGGILTLFINRPSSPDGGER